MASVAGPSRPSLFRSSSLHIRSSSIHQDSPSRYSSPNPLGVRIRSQSVAHGSFNTDAQIRVRIRATEPQLQNAWDALEERWGNIDPDEDDEIDLISGQVIKPRGLLQRLLEDGYDGYSEALEEEPISVDPDEDELGNPTFGLDDQTGILVPGDGIDLERNEWDRDLMGEFMRAEAARGGLINDSAGEEGSESDSSTREVRMSPRLHGTRLLSAPLVLSDEESEDELEMENDPEATRRTPFRETVCLQCGQADDSQLRTRDSVQSSGLQPCETCSHPRAPLRRRQ